jgi:cytidine deaminase
MRNKIFNYFEIAAKTAVSKSDNRAFLLAAVGERNDGTLVKSLNSPTTIPDRTVHAEARLCKKLDYNSVVYVARVKICDGKPGMARPCNSCMKTLISKKVKRVYYTISEQEYGVIGFSPFWEERRIMIADESD